MSHSRPDREPRAADEWGTGTSPAPDTIPPDPNPPDTNPPLSRLTVPPALAGSAPTSADDPTSLTLSTDDPTSLTRSTDDPTSLTLSPPEPVPVITTDQVAGMVPLDPQTAAALAQRAASWIEDVSGLDPQSPDFAAKVHDVAVMGAAQIRAAAQVSNRILERPVRELTAGSRPSRAPAPAKGAADQLVQLRQLIQDLDPSQMDRPARKILGVIPFGNRLRDYFDRYRSSQTHLNAVISSLRASQDELVKDNTAIAAEKTALWDTMRRLQEYAVLTSALDRLLDSKCAELSTSDPRKAETLRADLLLTVRQKHQDLLTQLAVSAQSYLALDMVRRNNAELIKGVERATTTTVSALRTAVVVAQALASQRLVLDQISALNETTSSLIVSTSELLRQQTGEVQQQAAHPTVGLESLRSAFRNVYATMDAVDAFTLTALDNMASTISALEAEVSRSKEYLERAQGRTRQTQTQPAQLASLTAGRTRETQPPSLPR